ncbi:MAG: undecaprenyldiphospho-muramoylpentapeptide beta-N-acetylglucosaminyltransferase [Eubacteriales bacterium]
MIKRIVMTGGGSAGHVMPNIALMPILKKHNYDICYIGSKNGIEKEIIKKEGIPYYEISTGKLRRYLSLKNVTDPFRILKGYFSSIKILKELKPQVIFSKGGFVSVPVVFAASHLKIPVVLHECDYTPGLANKLTIPKAKTVCVSFKDTLKYISGNKAVYTGTPVRPSILTGDKKAGLDFLDFKDNKPILLIMGGSLGAHAINTVVDSILLKLISSFNVVHIRGKNNLNNELKNIEGYRQFEYINEELSDIFAATDIMISRAGANAVFEILALRIPALLIPLPKSASRGDQILNAKYFSKNVYSSILFQEDLTEKSLLSKINALYHKKEKYIKNMRSATKNLAEEKIVEQILKAIE